MTSSKVMYEHLRGFKYEIQKRAISEVLRIMFKEVKFSPVEVKTPQFPPPHVGFTYFFLLKSEPFIS